MRMMLKHTRLLAGIVLICIPAHLLGLECLAPIGSAEVTHTGSYRMMTSEEIECVPRQDAKKSWMRFITDGGGVCGS